jgi:cytochrome P450
MSGESPASPGRLHDAPGPPRHLLAGNLPDFRRAPLDFLLGAAREYGEVVGLRMGLRRVQFLRHPEHIQHVLQRNQDNYLKQRQSRFLFGSGVATTNGEVWQRQRRTLQPLFRHPEGGAAVAAALAERTKRWGELAAAAQPVDLAEEMVELTLELLGATLFGSDFTAVTKAVRDSVTAIRSRVTARLLSALPLPLWLPSRGNRVLRASLGALDAVIYRLIELRSRVAGTDDFITSLLAARDPLTGDALTHRQLRDEIVTMLVAGHENTGNALAWTWYLVASHPAVEQRLHAELDATLGSRQPTWSDLAALPYTRTVVAESLRLYPPVWIVRIALRADAVGGYHIPARSMVLISPYVTHRHPDFWPEPEEFRPERFATGMDSVPHRFAYLPFGGGGRRCLGLTIAAAECQLIVATLAQRFRINLVPGHPVELQPIPTLAPRHGLRAILRPRSPFGTS